MYDVAIHDAVEDKPYYAKDDDFHLAAAEALQEVCKLVKVRFEQITDMHIVRLFIKTKTKMRL